jgi:hypothetical protein
LPSAVAWNRYPAGCGAAAVRTAHAIAQNFLHCGSPSTIGPDEAWLAFATCCNSWAVTRAQGVAAGTGAGLSGGVVCVVVVCVGIGALDVDSGVPDALTVVGAVDVGAADDVALGAAGPVGPLWQALRHRTAPSTATAETSTLTEGFLPIP